MDERKHSQELNQSMPLTVQTWYDENEDSEDNSTLKEKVNRLDFLFEEVDGEVVGDCEISNHGTSHQTRTARTERIYRGSSSR